GIGARCSGVLGELCRVRSALGAAVHRDLQLAPRLEEELSDALPVLHVEEHSLPRRPEGEDPVDAVRGEECDIRLERLGIDRRAARRERRDGCCETSAKHEADSMLCCSCRMCESSGIRTSYGSRSRGLTAGTPSTQRSSGSCPRRSSASGGGGL